MPWMVIVLLLHFVFTPFVARGASLSPSVIELSARRGETVESAVTVINTSGAEQTYFAGVMLFEPNEDGSSPIFLQGDVQSAEWPNWIVPAFSEFRVPANSKAELPFKIIVPSDVASGGYYAAVTVSQAPSDIVAGNGAAIEAKIAALVLLRVEGETVEQAEALELLNSGQGTGGSLRGPFLYRMQNQGNVHVTPVGAVTITDVLGRAVVSFDANPARTRVLPGTTRTYETETSEQASWFAIGPMRAQLDVTYGSTGQKATAQTEFWYVPWEPLIVMAVVLVVLGSFASLRMTGKKNRPQNNRKTEPASQ